MCCCYNSSFIETNDTTTCTSTESVAVAVPDSSSSSLSLLQHDQRQQQLQLRRLRRLLPMVQLGGVTVPIPSHQQRILHTTANQKRILHLYSCHHHELQQQQRPLSFITAATIVRMIRMLLLLLLFTSPSVVVVPNIHNTIFVTATSTTTATSMTGRTDIPLYHICNRRPYRIARPWQIPSLSSSSVPVLLRLLQQQQQLRGGGTTSTNDDEEEDEMDDDDDDDMLLDFDDDDDDDMDSMTATGRNNNNDSEFDEATIIDRFQMGYIKTPPFTKLYLSISFLITMYGYCLNQNEFPNILLLHWTKVITQFQWWRIFTSFFHFGPFGLGYIMTVQFVWVYMSTLERIHHSTPYDFWIMILFGQLCMVIGYPMMKLSPKFLGHNLSTFLVYIWSRYHEGVEVSMFDLFTTKAEMLPWFFLGQTFLLEGEIPVLDFLGIVFGHIYHHCKTVGILRAPKPLTEWYEHSDMGQTIREWYKPISSDFDVQ